MVTVDLNVELQLSEDVMRKAREDGLLTDEGLAELITAEIERRRQEAAARLLALMDKMHAHMREKYGDLTDEEAQAMIDQWIAEADEETAVEDDARHNEAHNRRYQHLHLCDFLAWDTAAGYQSLRVRESSAGTL